MHLSDTKLTVRTRLDEHFDELRVRAGRFGDPDEIVRALRDASDGGKFIRPQLVLLAHSALGGNNHAAAIDVAAAFELLHTALVVHDDIIDRDWSRRGRLNISGHYRARAMAVGVHPDDAAHHGVSVGVIAGDLALSGALRLVATVRTGHEQRERLLEIMDDAVIASAIGELADIENPHGPPPTAADIARAHRAKTAVYTFEAPLQAGAVLAGAPESVVELVGEFGRHLGTAYQVLDDIAGVLGDERDTGKQAGGDIRTAKHTAVTVSAQAGALWADVHHLFGKPDISPTELAYFRDTLVRDGAISRAEASATRHVSAATLALDGMPEALRAALVPILGMVLSVRLSTDRRSA
jgi:geranylgeranyl diphosphate synthase type II